MIFLLKILVGGERFQSDRCCAVLLLLLGNIEDSFSGTRDSFASSKIIKDPRPHPCASSGVRFVRNQLLILF